MRSGLCNCLAIYDWDGEVSVARFREIAQALFDRNNVLPDVALLTKPGSDNNELFEYPRFLKECPTELSGLDFYHTIPGYKQLIFGWDVCVSLNTHPRKTMLFCFAQDLAYVGLAYFEEIAQALAKEVTLKYGIGYNRDFKFGPDLYAHGLVAGLGYSSKDIEQADRISTWMHERSRENRHLRGYLRDVYPLNIISSCHLTRDVKGISLEQWINEDPSRGHIAQLSDDAWLWKIPEHHLAEVHTELQSSGCTIGRPH
jgi:hypothetical protein